jgi:hypothetical protein
MTKIVLIYGLISSLIIAGISSILLWSSIEHSSEWLGYLIMVIGLSLTYIAIKQHRDNNLGGIITFSKAFQVGILVTLIACLFYVLSWEIFYQNAGENYILDYQNSYIENMRSSGESEQKINDFKNEMQSFATQYENFFFRIFITLLEILPVGFIITLISALLLKNKKSK